MTDFFSLVKPQQTSTNLNKPQQPTTNLNKPQHQPPTTVSCVVENATISEKSHFVSDADP
jgi:hypothetical protein